jgi:hypothetical protein
MSAATRPGGIRGEKLIVETTYFGTPKGRAAQTSNARSVPMEPPSTITPSKAPSPCSFAESVAAPRAITCIAVFSFPEAMTALIAEPAAAAT